MKVYTSSLVCVIALTYLHIASGHPLKNRDTEPEDILISFNDVRRSARDVDSFRPDDEKSEFQFPDFLSLTFTLNGSDVTLELRLNQQQKTHVPVKLLGNGGMQEYKNSGRKDYAFYQILNDEVGAAVKIRCVNTTYPYSFHVFGHVHFNGSDYTVEPGTNTLTETQVPHKLYKLQGRQRSFEGDAVIQKVVKSLPKFDKAKMRPKRQTSRVNHVIEIEMVVDYYVYQSWLKFYNYDVSITIDAVRQYYEQVANGMDLRFSTASTATMSIDVVPLEILIIQDQVRATWIESNFYQGTVLAERALADFQAWVVNNRASLADFDAVITFTNKDIARIASDGRLVTSVLGMAYSYSMTRNGISRDITATCAKEATFMSAAIVEDSNDAGHTAAHELAHTMGVGHDALEPGCESSQQFVMTPVSQSVSPALANHPWTFSNCSVRVMEQTLTDLLQENGGTSCLQTSSYDVSEYSRIISAETLGEIYSLDDQCRYRFGDGSYDCRITGYTGQAICYTGIFCLLPGTNTCQNINVMPGSDCTVGRCYRGLCETNLSVRTTQPPTTQKPTTLAPTTKAPTTKAPTTRVPTTRSPTTRAPTQAPTTRAPTTRAPTQAPTTRAPTTQVPTRAPSTRAPTTQAPTTKSPTTRAPTTQAPTTKAPTTKAPTTRAPTTKAPATRAPTTKALATQAPTTKTTITTTATSSAPPSACNFWCQILKELYKRFGIKGGSFRKY